MKAKHLFLIIPILFLLLPLRVSAWEIKVAAPPDKKASSDDASDDTKGDSATPDDTKAGAAADQETTTESGTDKKEVDKKGEDKKGGKEGVSIMSAEQGEELQKKVEKVAEDQKKIMDKLDQIEKDIEFLRASSRVR